MRRLLFLVGIIIISFLLFRFFFPDRVSMGVIEQSVLTSIATRGLDASGDGLIWLGHWLKQTDPNILSEQIELHADKIRNQFEPNLVEKKDTDTTEFSFVNKSEETQDVTSSSPVHLPLSDLFLSPKNTASP